MRTLWDQPIIQIYCAQHNHLIDVVHVYRLFSPASFNSPYIKGCSITAYTRISHHIKWLEGHFNNFIRISNIITLVLAGIEWPWPFFENNFRHSWTLDHDIVEWIEQSLRMLMMQHGIRWTLEISYNRILA